MTVPALRLTHRDAAPVPHPQVQIDPGADELRRRMVTYVRDQLVTHPNLIEIGWPLEMGWDALHVWATLTRGELVIPAWWRSCEWWMPQRRSAARPIVASLRQILTATHAMYADADESGRLRRGRLVLEPGVRRSREGLDAFGVQRYCRIGAHRALTLAQAVEAGWVVICSNDVQPCERVLQNG